MKSFKAWRTAAVMVLRETGAIIDKYGLHLADQLVDVYVIIFLEHQKRLWIGPPRPILS